MGRPRDYWHKLKANHIVRAQPCEQARPRAGRKHKYLVRCPANPLPEQHLSDWQPLSPQTMAAMGYSQLPVDKR